MKTPHDEGRRIGRTMKWTALVVSVAMLGMCYQPPQLRLASATLANMSRQGSAPPRTVRPPSRDQALTSAMEALARALEAALAHEGPRAEADAQLANLTRQLDQVERDNVAAFAQVERHLVERKLPAVMLERHRQAVRTFEAKLAELRGGLVALQAARTVAERKRLTERTRELLGSRHAGPTHRPVDPKRLPFRAAGREPVAPALDAKRLEQRLASLQAGGDVRALSADTGAAGPLAAAAPADLAATEDAQLTPAVRELATSLGNNPVRIFNWVHDNVRFVPTYGSVQGSELTLINKQGNAFDTASLLIALLRAANIPARYAYGTVQVPAAKVRAWVADVPSVQVAQELMGNGGIPNVALVQGGTIAALRLEHVWVEALVDFEPSRGAVNKQGDTWVPLDASFKQHQRVAPLDLRQEVSVNMSGILANVNAAAQPDATGGVIQMFPGYAQSAGLDVGHQAEQELLAKYPNLTDEQVTGTLRIVPRGAQVLDASLPYDVVARGAPTSALPAGLRHAVSLRMYASSLDRALESPDVEVSVSLARLGNRRLSVIYAPASDADAQLIKSYKDSGASSLPVYLVHVVPQVQLDGTTIATGATTTMGTSQSWELSLTGPDHRSDAPDVYDITAGSVSVFGIDGNGVTLDAVQARSRTSDELTVAENMHQVGLRYFYQHDMFDELTARVRNVFKLRLPSAGLFSAPLDVRYLFGLPRSGSFSARMMDVKRVLLAVSADSDQARFDYMSQVGMQGSYLEGSVLDQVFQRMPGEASSTAQVFLDAASDQIPIYSLDASNVGTVLPMLAVSSDVRSEIAAAVQAGKIVVVPKSAPRGVMGYLIQDRETGAGAYLIDGGLSGGIGKDCDEEPEPEPIRVPNPSPLFWFFLVMAILVTIGLILTPGGQGGGLVLARVVAAIVFAMVLAPSNAYAAQPRLCCIPKPVPHLGGDALHNHCADVVPPNVHPGFDVMVDGKNFDALDDFKNLWEAKTKNSARYNQNDFMRNVVWPQELANDRMELLEEQRKAHGCEYGFNLAAGDPVYAAAMVGAYDNVVIDPVNCLQPL